MGYYCTVPQCTSLAGKTKNVKFHRFPRDGNLAVRWNEILHRNKPVTKYSKVCSLHFTQADYNITTMGKRTGQWKTLSKDAIPTQNLPRLNADGTVMVIRKSRTVKYKPEGGELQTKKDGRDESAGSDKREWANQSASSYVSSPGRSANTSLDTTDSSVHYRLSALNAIANNISPQLKSVLQQAPKPGKHDATMQTDPLDPLGDASPEPLRVDEKENKRGETQKGDFRYVEVFSHSKPNPKNYSKESDSFDKEVDYSKSDDLSKAAEMYALERNNKRNGSYEAKLTECYNKLTEPYKSSEPYKKLPETFNRSPEPYNKLPEAYNKLPEPFNTLPESYNKSSESYDKLPESYDKSPGPYEKLPESYNKSPESYDKLAESFNKSPESYDKLPESYNKSPESFNKMLAYKSQEVFNKQQEIYKSNVDTNESYQSRNGYADSYFAHGSAEVLRSQQQSLQMLQQRMSEHMADDSRFYGGRIKEEIDLNNEEEKFLAYETQKEDYVTQSVEVENALFTHQQRHHLLQQQQRLMELYERPTVKTEPDLNRGCETVMQPQQSPVTGYYRSEQHTANIPTNENACPLNQGVAVAAYYSQQRAVEEAPALRQQQMFSQPGAELLIAKQNALAAHTTLWPNSAKRPFFYGENNQLHSQLHPRCEDLARLLNQ